MRSGLDAFAHPTWRQTDVEPVDDELIALWKAHPDVPVMTSMWTPRHEIYGARPYWMVGTVASGKNADFLVLDANPLDNIANTRRISRVYLRGSEVDRAALKAQLSRGSTAAARPPTTH